MLAALVGVSVVLQVLLALFVYAQNRASRVHVTFMFLSFAVLGWALLNYQYTLDPFGDSVIYTLRLIMLLVVAQNFLFYLFAHAYSDSPKKTANAQKLYIGLTIFSAAATVSPFVFTGVEYLENGANPIPGPGMPVFILHALISVIAGFWILTNKYKKSKGLTKAQTKYILSASIVLWGIVPFTNFIITLAIKTNTFAAISPVFTTVFSSIIAYNIIRHRFLDIRFIVVRTVTYVLLIGFIAITYGIAIFGFSQFVVDETQFNTTELIVFTTVAVFLALSFQPIKRYFDKVTKRLFFRDSYDSDIVLNQLSAILATEIDLIKIVRDSSILLHETFRSTHLRFVVFDSENRAFYDYGTSSAPKNTVKYNDFFDIKEPLIVRDGQSRHVRKILSIYDSEIALKLETNDSFVGVILIGPKRTGSIYTSQDMNLMRISEKELSIAVQNSRYFEQIQKFNITLQRKVKQATTRLEHSNQKLKALDEAKDEFISMASHQLRTPLTSIKGYVSMVLEGDAGKINKQQAKLLEEAFASSQRMVYLIADLLNVSRLRTGKFIIEKSEADLSEMIRSEVEQLKPTAKARKLKLVYEQPKKFPKIMLDETKTRQVIMNFTDNAIYYTPAGGTINVAVKAKRDHVEFTVKDDGIGVPKEKQAKLFSKFYRADNAKKARPDGTGLGLFMAKKVILAQGGSIIFESKEGKGSTFGFRLKR